MANHLQFRSPCLNMPVISLACVWKSNPRIVPPRLSCWITRSSWDLVFLQDLTPLPTITSNEDLHPCQYETFKASRCGSLGSFESLEILSGHIIRLFPMFTFQLHMILRWQDLKQCYKPASQRDQVAQLISRLLKVDRKRCMEKVCGIRPRRKIDMNICILAQKMSAWTCVLDLKVSSDCI